MVMHTFGTKNKTEINYECAKEAGVSNPDNRERSKLTSRLERNSAHKEATNYVKPEGR